MTLGTRGGSTLFAPHERPQDARAEPVRSRNARLSAIPRWPTTLATAAAAYAILGASITLVGWAADIQRLTCWKNDGISMFPNTAVCVLLSGVVLLQIALFGQRLRVVTRAVSGVVLALGGLTLFQHLTGIDLGIDTMLFGDRSWGQFAAAAPMRMGPPASLSFVIIGIALALWGSEARGTSAGLGVTVAAIAMLSLTGHFYGVQQMYTIPRLTGIAMQTATMIFALALGLVAAVRDREPMRTILEPSAAGNLARRALPTIVVIALSLGWVRVYIQNQGLVDTAFGTALRTLIEILLLTGLLWWAVAMVRGREQALRASEAEVRRQAGQLAAFLDTAAICLHRVGADGTILWANDAELETFGYVREEYIGHHIAEFHADQNAIADILARLHRGEKLFEYEAAMKCKDGSIKWVLIDSSVLRDEGRFVHTQCFTRDITERKKAEAEREENDRRKDEFLAILAHELRNPLAPIRNAATYLMKKGAPDGELRRPVEMIERQVAQMSRLIDDLLDVSRISRGTMGLRRERVQWSEIAEAALDACRDEIQAKGHELRVTQPTEPIEVDADRERLVQVLCNLIGNAARYTPAGGRIEVSVAAVAHGTLEVSVKDDGIGIPSGKLTEIFDLFARVDHSLERQGGLGIGLTLVRQLVELHGGTIDARSDGLGRGSEFLVKLPVVVAMSRTAPPLPSPGPRSAPLRVLVADDNHDTAESLALILQMAGHDVHVAFDGEAALDSSEKLLPQVALLDIGMPKANGYEVARRIRAQAWGRGIYLVAVTGWGQDGDKRRAREAGFDAHLVKPVEQEALDRLLAEVGDSTTPRASPGDATSETG